MKRVVPLGVISVFILSLILYMSGCAGETEEKIAKVPEDFSFSLVWDVNGISSYDSASGKLIKTSDSTHPEDYITVFDLPDSAKEEIYELLVEEINIFNYPTIYDPFAKANGEPGVMSEPNQDVVLNITCNGEQKTVKCNDITWGHNYCVTKEGKRFIKAIEKITDYLTTTPEWEALPEYEFFYD